GLLCAFLAFQMREPLRGSAEKVGQAVAKTYDASVGKFFELMKIPTLRATILSQTLLYFVLASNAFWLPILLHRRFNLTASQGGLLAGVVIVLAGLVARSAGAGSPTTSARTPRRPTCRGGSPASSAAPCSFSSRRTRPLT